MAEEKQKTFPDMVEDAQRRIFMGMMAEGGRGFNDAVYTSMAALLRWQEEKEDVPKLITLIWRKVKTGDWSPDTTREEISDYIFHHLKK